MVGDFKSTPVKPLLCPTCGATTDTSVTINGVGPFAFCMKRKCQAARLNAIDEHVKQSVQGKPGGA